MTLGQLEALEERRAIEIRHARFNAALVTAALINSHRASDSRAITPFDFLAGFETDPEEQDQAERLRAVKHGVAVAFSRLPDRITTEQWQEFRAKIVSRLLVSGYTDAEQIVNEVIPHGGH